jgi:quercetin dioxygenase-like cupin family protein
MIIRGKVIKRKVLETDSTYEPGLSVSDGINNKIVEGARLLMGYSFLPPGGRNQRHYHVNTDAGMYILRGHVRFILGPDDDRREMDAEMGDFIYTPQGEIHGLINLSDSEPVELIAIYNRVGCKEDAGTIFVESGHKQGNG